MPGTITFKPIEANLTHDTDLIGKADPYCMFTIGGQVTKGQVCKSGGKHPVWNDAVTIPSTNQGVCLVEVKDKDILKDDRMGSFQIDLQQLQSQGRLKQWFPLLRKDKPAGELLLEIIFSPDGHSQGMPMGMHTGIQTGIHTGTHTGMPVGTHMTCGTMGPNVTEKTQVITKETYVNGVKVDGHSNFTHSHPQGTHLAGGMIPNSFYNNGTQPAYPVNNMGTNNQYAQEALIRGVDPLGTHHNHCPQQTAGNTNFIGANPVLQTNLGYPQQQVGGQYNQNIQNQPSTYGPGHLPKHY